MRFGEAREKEYLTRIQYGNADPSGGVDRFCLDGASWISAMETGGFPCENCIETSFRSRSSISVWSRIS